MSVLDEYELVSRQSRTIRSHTRVLRLFALTALGVATLSYLSVLFHVTNVVGGRGRLLAVVVVAFLAAFGAAKTLTPRAAGAITLVALFAGAVVYLAVAPPGIDVLLGVGNLVRDWLAILSGYTVLGIVAADVWVAAFAPAPIFLSWYLGFRGEYALAAAVAGVAAAFFMLSGDLSFSMALIGVLAIAATIGFGELARRQATIGHADLVVVVLAGMMVGSIVVPLIPAEGGQPINPGDGVGGGSGSSLEQTLIGSDEQIDISSRPSLDPSVRFTISSPIESRWRVDAYDRYTGTGWVQTGESGGFDDSGLAGDRVQSIEMAVRPEQAGTAMPTIWRPVGVEGVSPVAMSPEQGLIPTGSLDAGEPYFVQVERPDVLYSEVLIADDREYPDRIEERYTQLPDSTPDEVGQLTGEVIGETNSTYRAAQRVEEYLLTTNNYSLDVSRPQGDIAYEMLFERDAGYCVYFASTMVAMLRSQDIPARFVTGYSSGEAVGDNEWVVRGMDAHAWVEVYVPDVGWVEFDPTPSSPYNDARQERLEAARESGDGSVDLDPDENFTVEGWEPSIDLPPLPQQTQNQTTEEEILARADELEIHCGDPRAIEEDRITVQEALIVCSPEDQEVMGVPEALGVDENQTEFPGSDGSFDTGNITNGSDDGTLADDIANPAADEDDGFTQSPTDGERGPGLPSPRQLGILFALGVGAAVGVRRSGLGHRVRHEVALRWQGPIRQPQSAVERAWRRLELHLSETATPRKPDESVRAYVDRLDGTAGDERIHEVVEAYERARYSDTGVSAAEAKAIVRLVDEIVDRSVLRPRR